MKVQALRPPSAPATLQLQVQSSIATYLRRQGWRLEVSRGDGNCIFRSFSFQLTGNQDNHISVRTLLLRFENLNPSAFQPYLTPINYPTMAEHISHVQKPDVFGTHLEILAIATFYNVPVYYCQLLRGPVLLALRRAHEKCRGEFQSSRSLREPTGRDSATITFRVIIHAQHTLRQHCLGHW